MLYNNVKKLAEGIFYGDILLYTDHMLEFENEDGCFDAIVYMKDHADHRVYKRAKGSKKGKVTIEGLENIISNGFDFFMEAASKCKKALVRDHKNKMSAVIACEYEFDNNCNCTYVPRLTFVTLIDSDWCTNNKHKDTEIVYDLW